MSPKAYTVDFHPQVSKDYEDAYEWYELQQTDLGSQFLLKMREKISDIINSPEAYSTKTRKEGYREARIDGFPYLIVYKIYTKNKKIFINGIHHEKMNPKRKHR